MMISFTRNTCRFEGWRGNCFLAYFPSFLSSSPGRCLLKSMITRAALISLAREWNAAAATESGTRRDVSHDACGWETETWEKEEKDHEFRLGNLCIECILTLTYTQQDRRPDFYDDNKRWEKETHLFSWRHEKRVLFFFFSFSFQKWLHRVFSICITEGLRAKGKDLFASSSSLLLHRANSSRTLCVVCKRYICTHSVREGREEWELFVCL